MKNMSKILILVCLVAASASVRGVSIPSPEELQGATMVREAMSRAGVSDKLLESNIVDLVESILASIPEHIDYKDLNISALNDNFQVLGHVENVTTRGFPDHVLDNVKFSILPIRYTMHLGFPDIGATGLYDLDGLFAHILPLYGYGQFDIGVSGVEFSLRVDLTSYQGHLVVSNIDLGFEVGACTFQFDHLLGGDLGVVVGEILEDNMADYVARVMYYYGEDITNGITSVLNEFLKDKSIDDLIDWITGLKTTAAPLAAAATPADNY